MFVAIILSIVNEESILNGIQYHHEVVGIPCHWNHCWRSQSKTKVLLLGTSIVYLHVVLVHAIHYRWTQWGHDGIWV